MRKIIRWTAMLIILALVAIQFVPTDLTNPPVTAEIAVGAELQQVLRRSCYDCHSNETVWPWYAHVAPVSWLVAEDVRVAREALNFSIWSSLPRDRQKRLMEEIWEEVEHGEMPLGIYRLMHSDASLGDADKELIRRWATGRAPTGR